MDQKIKLLGVKITSTPMDELLVDLRSCLVSRGRKKLVMVVTPNPEQVVQANEDDSFRSVLNGSDISIPDGVGLVIAERILNSKFQIPNFKSISNSKFQNSKPNRDTLSPSAPSITLRTSPLRANERRDAKLTRIAGIELAEELIQICQEEGLRVLLLGGREGVAEEAAVKILNLKSQIPNKSKIQNPKFKTNNDIRDTKYPSASLRASEIHGLAGSKDIAHETPEEREAVLEQIRKYNPHLILVGYGAPWQEKWIASNRVALEKVGVRVAMVVGGVFDEWAGKVKRTPDWVLRIGFKWLYRLIQEPWRWRRQLRLIKFMGMVIRELVI